jgi:hypothetical protein
MGMFDFLFGPDQVLESPAPSTHTIKAPPQVYNKNWRQGMWVMHDDHIAILYKIGEPSLVHYVDTSSGETVKEVSTSLGALRQARFVEIPTSRMKLSQEKALELGYGA